MNLLYEHCLVAGYADQIRRIDAATVTAVVGDLEAGRVSYRNSAMC